MKANVNFEATVVVGLGGVAVLDLKERCADGYVLDDDQEPDCVRNDILECGAECWAEYSLDDMPIEHGIYRVSGGAYFTEDDAVYSVVVEGV